MSDERVEGVVPEFSRTIGFVIRQPIAPGETPSVRDRIAEGRPADESGIAWLLPGDDVATVSLFLVRGDGGTDEGEDENESGSEDEDALVWYVEVEDDGAWADPVAELARRTPLYAGSEGSLAGAPRLYGDAEQVVHASNSSRPGRPESPDVVLVRIGIESGLATRVARLVAGAVDLLEGTRVARKLESSSGEVIEDERMWTETLFLDDADDDYAILWYMEADDMDQVMEVYETTDNRVARWSEVVLDFLFEEPMAALGDPMDASEYELLAHETNAARR